MSAYTVLQLFELLLFSGVFFYGSATHRPSIVVLAGGLLLGKAVLNVIGSDGASLYRRSLIGYGVGAIFIAVGVVLFRIT